MELGPNLALSLLDLSQSGVRLVLNAELPKGQEVSIALESPAVPRGLKRSGVVMWSVPAADGTFCVGVQFHKWLDYADLQRLS
jgi:hypothetical protein